MHIELIEGKVFRSANGEEFGIICRLDSSVPPEVAERSFVAFAEDECGNFFVQRNGAIAFWNHETDELVPLARSEQEFMARLVSPQSSLAHQGKVVSAWIDPKFLKAQNSK